MYMPITSPNNTPETQWKAFMERYHIYLKVNKKNHTVKNMSKFYEEMKL